MPGFTCPQCGADNREQARFCCVCGIGLKPGIFKADLPSDENHIVKLANITKEDSPTTTSSSQIESKIEGEHHNIHESVAGAVLMGRYRILTALGRGGYGAVYRAWDIHLNKAVAIKENLDITPEAQRQFGREASILAHLSHSNLVRVTDHFSVPGEGQYLVMDFVEGNDIETLIKQNKSIPLNQALGWVSQILDALEYLHSRQPQVIHRDIKPANIRITPDDRALLVDFGLAKIYKPEVPTTHGARGVSPGYAPPEQYGKGKTDARSDIYSLCAALYHMLTGQKPPESVLRSPDKPITPAHLFVPQLPLHISMAIQTGMAIEPDCRFCTVNELKIALLSEQTSSSPSIPATQLIDDTLDASSSIANIPVQLPSKLPISKSKTRSLRLALIILAGLILLVVTGLFLAGLSLYQIRMSAQATYDANIQASAFGVVNATHTANAIKRLSTTQSP